MQSEIDVMTQALDDLVEWMNEHGAASFVAKLRPPASEAALEAAETKIGAPLGDALRALYRWHDGQAWAEQKEPFFETLFFLDLKEALRQRPEMLTGYLRVPAGSTFADYHAAHAAIDEEVLRSEHWFPFAEASFHFFAVHLGTQRVIRITKATTRGFVSSRRICRRSSASTRRGCGTASSCSRGTRACPVWSRRGSRSSGATSHHATEHRDGREPRRRTGRQQVNYAGPSRNFASK